MPRKGEGGIKIEEKRYRKIYVLELGNKGFKYYVGHTSKTMENIFKEHLQGGRALTKNNQPIRIVEVSEIGLTGRAEADKLTTNKVIECMGEYGIENVRGGRFTSLNKSYHLQDVAYSIDYSKELDNNMAFLAPQLEKIRKQGRI
ncbi:hypothetical protein A5821_000269 [Enterococcus sp. 7F3_DIV0205]|uniref:GIY-YIG domain-containing protein n=1 Tax=Candidatus Enterococcus palustris TaxID=1834189 RepID=A0AAQ3W643_9ENTE|nr:hypothetical protein [Enterococcus sp. 7F3_DIV0205]OTN84680.1 hypothetical protein A5821_000609 [Enterococcus sp. 7F3_DIV0205]